MTTGPEPRSALVRACDWAFRDRSTGRIVVGQWPNPPLWTWLGARAVLAVADPAGGVRTAVQAVGTIALLWWSGDEVVRGVNPWRRALGTVVGLATIAGLVW